MGCPLDPSVPTSSGKLSYSVQHDSALFYYRRGWEQIMDEGHYGPAEASYRKTLSFDPDFLVGKSVLARLTLDLEERLQLYEELDANKERIQGDERKVLDVYLALTHFTNLREQTPERAGAVLQEVLKLAETNVREVVHRYPNEVYLKAEYLEILHSLHGPQAALDSLAALATPTQRETPFLLGFAASLRAELGEFNRALELAQRLETMQGNAPFPKAFAVWADVYVQMDSLSRAKSYADRAVTLDPRNLDASRLQARIEERLKARTARQDGENQGGG